jgi:hypothetical protein
VIRPDSKYPASLGSVRGRGVGTLEADARLHGSVLDEPGFGAFPLNPGGRARRVGGERVLECLRSARRISGQDAQISNPFPEIGGQIRLMRLASADLLGEPLRLWRGFDTELVCQHLAQMSVGAQRFLAAAGQRMKSYQPNVALLAQLVFGSQPQRRCDGRLDITVCFERCGELVKRGDEFDAELLARFGRPGLVAVLGEQAVAIKLDGAAVLRDLTGATGCRYSSPELVDVQGELATRKESRSPRDATR